LFLSSAYGSNRRPREDRKAEGMAVYRFVFASIYAYVKLELAKPNHGYNHFAVKSQIYPASLKKAMELLFVI
jgi:hypothetical protein